TSRADWPLVLGRHEHAGDLLAIPLRELEGADGAHDDRGASLCLAIGNEEGRLDDRVASIGSKAIETGVRLRAERVRHSLVRRTNHVPCLGLQLIANANRPAHRIPGAVNAFNVLLVYGATGARRARGAVRRLDRRQINGAEVAWHAGINVLPPRNLERERALHVTHLAERLHIGLRQRRGIRDRVIGKTEIAVDATPEIHVRNGPGLHAPGLRYRRPGPRHGAHGELLWCPAEHARENGRGTMTEGDLHGIRRRGTSTAREDAVGTRPGSEHNVAVVEYDARAKERIGLGKGLGFRSVVRLG